MTSWPDRITAACQAAGGPELGVKLCQVIKGGHYGGKYDKCLNLHACLNNSGESTSPNPRLQMFSGAQIKLHTFRIPAHEEN